MADGIRDDALRMRKRHLPHWQIGGRTYFVTFHSARGSLPPAALEEVVRTVLHDHQKRYDLHFAVVMPDHVHLILRPCEQTSGVWYDLAEISKAIKGVSARRINLLLGTTGTVWQSESFDRIIRDDNEFEEKRHYMWMNPLKAGLVEDVADYPFFIIPEA